MNKISGKDCFKIWSEAALISWEAYFKRTATLWNDAVGYLTEDRATLII